VVRVALIGTGGIASLAHIPAWRTVAGAEVVAVAEPVAERRQRALALLGDPEGRRVAAFADYGELLAAVRPELVDITVKAGPVKSAAIVAALDAGCHVTCQKPFALELPEAERLVRHARERGRLLSVNQQARFAGAFAKAARWVAEGRLGELRTIRLWSEFPNAGPQQWLEYGVHSFDLVRFWAGREPRRVRAWWKPQTAQGHHLLAVWLDFEGVLAAEIWDEMSSSTTLRWGFRLMGSAGSVQGHEAFGPDMLPAEVAFAPARAACETREPAGPPYIPGAFAAYFSALVAAVRGEGPCPIPAEDNLRTLRLAFAARRAADLGDWLDLERGASP
jgi:predicted dehydrogenase